MNKWKKRNIELYYNQFIINNCNSKQVLEDYFFPNPIAIYLASLFNDILRFTNESLIAIDNLLIKSIKEYNILMIKMCELALSITLSLKYQKIIYLNS